MRCRVWTARERAERGRAAVWSAGVYGTLNPPAVPTAPQLPPLLRDAAIAVASLDLTGHIADANDALAAAGGYTLEQLRGRSFFDFLEPEAAADARARFATLTSGAAATYHAERRYRSADGRMHDVELTVSLVRDDQGAATGCLAVLQDLTPHKAALRDAARRTAQLEAVIENMPAAVYISDGTGLKTVNARGLAQLGFASIDEIAGRLDVVAERLHVRDALTGVPVPPDQGSLARALRGERVETEVLLTRAETGDERLLHVVAAPVMLDGKIVEAVALTQDITDQRATADALRWSEARYRGLIEQSPLSVQILAPDGRTLQVNAAWERLWGVKLADIAEYNILRDPQLVERGLMPTIERAFQGEPGLLPAILYDPDQTIPDKSSHEDPRRWVRAAIYPVKGPAGEVREVVLIHEDITEQMHADERRRAVESERERLLHAAQGAHADLQAAARVKDEFLATLSHELRTPLNAVLGWAKILRSRPIGDETTHAAAVIERNAVAQARLIEDLLDLSRIITGKTRLNVDDVDIRGVASDALESLRPAAEAKRISLTLNAGDDIPVLSADGHRLQQIYWNLLSNAVKFTEAGGSVTVSIAADEQCVTSLVSDTGIGVRADVLPIVFDRFTQGDSSSTRAYSGLGLGLSIVRHLVELHGGTVIASSAGPGHGSTFGFRLPRG